MVNDAADMVNGWLISPWGYVDGMGERAASNPQFVEQRRNPPQTRPGVPALFVTDEQDLANAIDQLIRRAGFAKTAFDTIVASGPNSALPHARPSERKLGEGDLVAATDRVGVDISHLQEAAGDARSGEGGTVSILRHLVTGG